MKNEATYMSADGKEVLNVLRGIIEAGKEADLREASAAFYQTHLNADSTQVSLRVRF